MYCRDNIAEISTYNFNVGTEESNVKIPKSQTGKNNSHHSNRGNRFNIN